MLFYMTIKVSDGTEFYLPTIVQVIKHNHKSKVTIKRQSTTHVVQAGETVEIKLFPGKYVASTEEDDSDGGEGYFVLTLNLRYNPILDVYSSLMQVRDGKDNKDSKARKKLAEAESYIKMLQELLPNV